jgi:NADH-quinone oxidoreductase subunit N
LIICFFFLFLTRKNNKIHYQYKQKIMIEQHGFFLKDTQNGASSLEFLDICTWCPEFYMVIGFSLLLLYSIHFGATLFTEVCGGLLHLTKKQSFAKEKKILKKKENWTDLKNYASPTINRLAVGPRDLISHLSDWSSLWLLLNIIVLVKHPWTNTLLFSSLFVRSSFTISLSVFLFAYAFICIQLSSQWLSLGRGGRHVEYFILILICIFGQHMLLQSVDLMSIYISLELQSFCLAILCSLNYKSQFSVEAGIKYFLLSAFSSGILLLGMSLIYWSTGLTNCISIRDFVYTSYPIFENMKTSNFVSSTPIGVDLLLILGVWLVSLAFLWKLSAAPLHMWAADVYQGSWSSVTLILSTLPKVAVFGCWMSVWQSIWYGLWPNTMVFFSGISMLVGAIAAMGQVLLKRLLAYSSINHIGILLMALCSQGGSSSALLTHLFIYLWTSLAVWGLILWPFKRPGHFNEEIRLTQYIWDFQILWKTHPLAAITWVIVMMSLAGLPPIAGFLGKLSVFWWTLNAHQYALVAIALLTTLLSSVYYLRVVRIMYMEAKPIKSWSSFTAMHTINAYIISISILGLLVLIWYSSPLILYTHLVCLIGA